jgi:hypothetical protein
VLQPGARWIHQHNATETPTGQLFDELAQRAWDLRERTTPGNHLQEPVLSGEQCLCLLQLAHAEATRFTLTLASLQFEAKRVNLLGGICLFIQAGLHCGRQLRSVTTFILITFWMKCNCTNGNLPFQIEICFIRAGW